LIPTFLDDFERFKTSVEEVTADVMERAREPLLEVEPDNVTALLQEIKWFLEMEPTPGVDSVKIVEMTAKDLAYYVNLVNKAVAGLRGFTPILKEVLLMGKVLSNSIAC